MRYIFFQKYLFIFVYLLVAALPTFPIYQKKAKYFFYYFIEENIIAK